MVCKCFMFFLLLLLFSIGCVQLHRISRSHKQQEPKTLTFYLLLRFWLGLCSGKFFVRPLVIFFTPVGDCIYSWWLYILGDCIFLVIVYILGDCIYSWWLYIFSRAHRLQQGKEGLLQRRKWQKEPEAASGHRSFSFSSARSLFPMQHEHEPCCTLSSVSSGGNQPLKTW